MYLKMNKIDVQTDEQSILRVDQLAIAAGECVGIRGASGSGKTTLLHVMSGLLLPSSGSVSWGGADITGMSETQRDTFRRDTIGLVFQAYLLFKDLSAFENVTVACQFSPASEREKIKKTARLYMDHFKLQDIAQRQCIATLSGGECQRLALVRALAHDPQVLLADEPTASLDEETGHLLVEDMLHLAHLGKTVIVVSHDRSVLKRMDRIIDVVNGCVQC